MLEIFHVIVTYLATNRHLPAPEGAATKVALEIPVDHSGIAGVTGVKHHSLGLFGGKCCGLEQRFVHRAKQDACVYQQAIPSIHLLTSIVNLTCGRVICDSCSVLVFKMEN